MTTLEFRRSIGELGEVFALQEIKKKIPKGFEVKPIIERSGADLFVHDGNGTKFYGEVKSAKEFFLHQYYNKKKGKSYSSRRRGQFHVFKHQLQESEFFCFVIRFVDDNFITTGEKEIFYALTSDVLKFLSYEVKSNDYKLCISNLPKINATKEFDNVFNELIKGNSTL